MHDSCRRNIVKHYKLHYGINCILYFVLKLRIHVEMKSGINILFILYCVSTVVARRKSIGEVLLPIFRTVGVNLQDRQEMINGINTTHFEHPYMVSIFNKTDGSHIGGGTIIKKNWILSLADFTVWLKPADLSVKIGPEQKEFLIDMYIVHPKYQTLGFESNLALYRISSQITFGTYIKPAVITSNKTVPNNTVATVTGWSKSSNKLNTLSVKVFRRNHCANIYGKMFTPNNVICALKVGAGPCFADWGDPLTYNGTLIGIFIGGYRCANDNFPGVYTHVANYYDWIQNVTEVENGKKLISMRTLN